MNRGWKQFNVKDATYVSGLWSTTDDGDIHWDMEHQMKASFGGILEVLSFNT